MTDQTTAEDMSAVAPNVYALVGAFLEGDRVGAGKIASRIERAGHTKAALVVAVRFGRSLERRAASRNVRMPDDPARQAQVRERLAAALPPEYELAVLVALDETAAGDDRRAQSALGDGPVGDMLVLYTLVAHIAVFGAGIYPAEKWSPAGLRQMAGMAGGSRR